MTHDDAFLQAIIEAPDDDTPRLVYADWLDENGQPERAEFIRVQCEVAGMPAGDPRWMELEARERELLEEHEEWVGPLRRWATRWSFQRGFVESVMLPVRVYLDHAADLVRFAPVRRFEVDLTDAVTPQGVLDLLPELTARWLVVLPLGERGGRLVIVAENPDIPLILDRELEVVVSPREQIIEALNRHYNQGEVGDMVSWVPELTETAIEFTETE